MARIAKTQIQHLIYILLCPLQRMQHIGKIFLNKTLAIASYTIHGTTINLWPSDGYMDQSMGLLPDMQNCRLRMRRECREPFPRHWFQNKHLVSDPDMHQGTCDARAMMHVGIVNPRWRGKCSRHSRRMRNLQFFVSGKRPMTPLVSIMDSDLFSV